MKFFFTVNSRVMSCFPKDQYAPQNYPNTGNIIFVSICNVIWQAKCARHSQMIIQKANASNCLTQNIILIVQYIIYYFSLCAGWPVSHSCNKYRAIFYRMVILLVHKRNQMYHLESYLMVFNHLLWSVLLKSSYRPSSNQLSSSSLRTSAYSSVHLSSSE